MNIIQPKYARKKLFRGTDLISNSSRLNDRDVKLGHRPTIEQREKAEDLMSEDSTMHDLTSLGSYDFGDWDEIVTRQCGP
jgi:hypothetical protein